MNPFTSLGGIGSAASQHSPAHNEHRMAQAKRRGPKTWVIVALYMAFAVLLLGLGIGLVSTTPSSPLNRIAGWVLLVSGSAAVLLGIVYLSRVWVFDRPATQTLFCTNDHDDHTKDSLNSP